jgi:hypothetical protein
MTMATYVLLIDTPDGANASIHATQIEAQTALLKFAAEHLAKHGKIVPRDDSDLLEALATFEAEAGDEGKEGELVVRIFTCFTDGTSECSGVPWFLTVPRPKEESTEEEIAAAFQSLIDDGSIVPHPDGRQRRNLKGELEPAYVAAEVAAELVKKRGGATIAGCAGEAVETTTRRKTMITDAMLTDADIDTMRERMAARSPLGAIAHSVWGEADAHSVWGEADDPAGHEGLIRELVDPIRASPAQRAMAGRPGMTVC